MPQLQLEGNFGVTVVWRKKKRKNTITKDGGSGEYDFSLQKICNIADQYYINPVCGVD
jgi:hypothetical protein